MIDDEIRVQSDLYILYIKNSLISTLDAMQADMSRGRLSIRKNKAPFYYTNVISSQYLILISVGHFPDCDRRVVYTKPGMICISVQRIT